MFHRTTPTASLTKHAIYLSAAIVLGLLLGFLVEAGVEMSFLEEGVPFPALVQYLLLLGGGVMGFYLGRFWWRKIYIEKVWCQK